MKIEVVPQDELINMYDAGHKCQTPENFDLGRGGTFTCGICGMTNSIMPLKSECGCVDSYPCEHHDWEKHEADYVKSRAKAGLDTPSKYLFPGNNQDGMKKIEKLERLGDDTKWEGEASGARLAIIRLKNRLGFI